MAAQTKSVDIEGDTEQQRLCLLGGGRAAGGPRREFAFGRREDRLDQRPLAVRHCWKVGTHLRSHAMQMPRPFTALGGDDAVGADDLPDKGMVQFTVELAIGQHTANGDQVAGALEQGAQPGAVVGWSRFGLLRQDDLARQVHDHHPLEPVSPGEPLAAVAYPVDKEGADRSRRQSRPIHRDDGAVGWRRRHPPQGFVQQPRQLVLAGPAHTAIQGRVVRHPLDAQCGAQLGMVTQTHLGFAIRPILIAHQTQDRQQGWLRERMLGEWAAILRQRRFSDVPRDTGKLHQSDFGHTTPPGALPRTGRSRMSTRPDRL